MACSFWHLPLHCCVTHTQSHTLTHTQWHLGGKCAVRRLRVPLMITTLHLNNLHPSSSALTSALSLSLKSLSTPPTLYLSLLFTLSLILTLSFSSSASILSIFFLTRGHCSCLFNHSAQSAVILPYKFLSSVWMFFSFQPSLKSIFNDDVISAFMCNLARVSIWMRHCQLYGIKHLFSVNGCSWWYTNQNPVDVWWIRLFHFCSCMHSQPCLYAYSSCLPTNTHT